jgi:hypothetical protein
MPVGPGKYDDACTAARLETGAVAVALIVLGGKQGHGFSVQGAPELVAGLPELLEIMAIQIRESWEKAEGTV